MAVEFSRIIEAARRTFPEMQTALSADNRQEANAGYPATSSSTGILQPDGRLITLHQGSQRLLEPSLEIAQQIESMLLSPPIEIPRQTVVQIVDDRFPGPSITAQSQRMVQRYYYVNGQQYDLMLDSAPDEFSDTEEVNGESAISSPVLIYMPPEDQHSSPGIDSENERILDGAVGSLTLRIPSWARNSITSVTSAEPFPFTNRRYRLYGPGNGMSLDLNNRRSEIDNNYTFLLNGEQRTAYLQTYSESDHSHEEDLSQSTPSPAAFIALQRFLPLSPTPLFLNTIHSHDQEVSSSDVTGQVSEYDPGLNRSLPMHRYQQHLLCPPPCSPWNQSNGHDYDGQMDHYEQWLQWQHLQLTDHIYIQSCNAHLDEFGVPKVEYDDAMTPTPARIEESMLAAHLDMCWGNHPTKGFDQDAPLR